MRLLKRELYTIKIQTHVRLFLTDTGNKLLSVSRNFRISQQEPKRFESKGGLTSETLADQSR
jgi:hypothetical protein